MSLSGEAHSPAVGEFRITVPLYWAGVSADGYTVRPQRWVLAPDVELVRLDEAETDRLVRGGLEFTQLRLEVFGIKPRIPEGWPTVVEPESPGQGHSQIGRAVTRILNLHSLVVRVPFRAASAVIDQFDGSVWRRVGRLGGQLPLRRGGGASYMPERRLGTWSTLLGQWPSNRPKLDLALDLHARSVEARWDRNYREALLAAATSTEVLFSEDAQEVTHKISQRAAQLVSPGAAGVTTFRRIKKLYGLRSKVVHSGSPADDQACTEWQQFLMAAIPRAAAYAGSDKQLIEDLDFAGFERSTELSAIDGNGWWSYCDYLKCVSPNTADPGAPRTS